VAENSFEKFSDDCARTKTQRSMSSPSIHTGPPRVAAVVPCYKVSEHIVAVVAELLAQVDTVYVVDDCCPDGSGRLLQSQVQDSRLRVLFHEANQGVGGAMLTGYEAAAAEGHRIIVKVDGDGQMDARLIPQFVAPIAEGQADYTKGNRFFFLSELHQMPITRIFGNAVLSFMAKVSTGYWDSFDPTNGFTAIHAALVPQLLREPMSRRYFFETDLLFRLNTLRAVVFDIPMDARYGDEVSNLKIRKILFEFIWGHARNTAKRFFYNYVLRGLSLATFQFVFGTLLTGFGFVFGGIRWLDSLRNQVPATAGTVMVAALSVLSGLQFLLAFLAYDFASVPRRAIHRFYGAIPPPTPVANDSAQHRHSV
jgi:dolichol-phosphate mannosyltransferase